MSSTLPATEPRETKPGPGEKSGGAAWTMDERRWCVCVRAWGILGGARLGRSGGIEVGLAGDERLSGAGARAVGASIVIGASRPVTHRRPCRTRWPPTIADYALITHCGLVVNGVRICARLCGLVGGCGCGCARARVLGRCCGTRSRAPLP